MRYWLTQNWPPEVGRTRTFSRIWIPDRLADEAVRLKPGDAVFVYETKTGPRRKQEVDSEEVMVDRQPGRHGVIGLSRVTGPVEDRGADETRWDGKQFNFRFIAPTEAVWDSGFVKPAQLRRALGWDPNAPIRNVAFREIDAETATELRRLLGVRADAPLVRERRSSRLDDLAEEEARGGQFRVKDDAEARERVLASIAARRGQPEFRRKLLAAYGGKCAISGCDFGDALEACHIVPHSGRDSNRVVNGLLLRGDLHTLFDRGWIGVDPESFQIIVHPELMSSHYAELSGRRIRVPRRTALRPAHEALRMQCHRAGLVAT